MPENQKSSIITPKVPKKSDPKPKKRGPAKRQPPASRAEGQILKREIVKKKNTRENLELAIELVMQGMTYRQIAKELGISEKTLYVYRKSTPAWKNRLEDARVDKLEDHAFEMAMGRAKGNPLCVMFLLKAAKPEIYRDDAQKIMVSATANANADAESKGQVDRTDNETQKFLDRMKKLGADPLSNG